MVEISAVHKSSKSIGNPCIYDDSFPCDAIVNAAGSRSNSEVEELVKATGIPYEVIGDAKRPKKILDAIWQGNSLARREGLATGQFDTVFTLQAYFEQASGYRVLPFRRNRLLLVAPELHPLADAGKVKIRELREEKFVLLNRQYSSIMSSACA